MEKESPTVENIGKKHEPLLPSRPTSFLVLDSSIDVKLRKLATDKTMKTIKPREDERKGHGTHNIALSFSRSLLNLY